MSLQISRVISYTLQVANPGSSEHLGMNHNILGQLAMICKFLFAYMHTCMHLTPTTPSSLSLSFHKDLVRVLLHRAGRQGEVSLLLSAAVN